MMDKDLNKRMLRRESLIGSPVISRTSGKQIATILDVQLSQDNQYVEAFRVASSGVMKKNGLLPFHQVISISNQGVVVQEENLMHVPQIHGGLHEPTEEALLGHKVVLEDGQSLGTISDILINPESGKISGMELSDGFVDDLVVGRRYMHVPPEYRQDGDMLVISKEDALHIESYQKGIKNIFLNKLN